MREPTRLHITWENPQTLKIETDSGVQTRRFAFGTPQPPAQRSLQGYSAAEWEIAGAGGRGAPAGPRRGNLKVTTTMMSGGWLRKNGVPYSENATLTEFYRPVPGSEQRGMVRGDDESSSPTPTRSLNPGLRDEHAYFEERS